MHNLIILWNPNKYNFQDYGLVIILETVEIYKVLYILTRNILKQKVLDINQKEYLLARAEKLIERVDLKALKVHQILSKFVSMIIGLMVLIVQPIGIQKFELFDNFEYNRK
ncbi:unnamed protein product [Paramecium octaurelia]|uniref:Uncharacterized protein n=1 Tax=Paramecium octaurelia TaxID=43137 RepID=A0A8S1RZI7_PAROT|nr:unnamed protein product [Paramecium octaurelia]